MPTGFSYAIRRIVRAVPRSLSVFAFASAAAALDLSHTPFPDDLKAMIGKDFSARDPECQSRYMIAFSLEGDWAARCSADLPAGDMMRSTLEFCEHGASAPCGLTVVNAEPVEWHAGDWTMKYPPVFDAGAVPFVASGGRRAFAANYVNATGKKALAINRDGVFGFATDAPDQGEATRLALVVCEQQTSKEGSCFLYAVGRDVVFTSETDIFPDR